jgi:hypothetical protein
VLRLLAATLAVAAAPVPAWIQRAVPGPIVAWREADVLGTGIPEGIAVSTAGGSYAVGVVDSRLDPPEEVMDFELAKNGPRTSVKTLLAGRITGAARGEVAVVLRLPGAALPRPKTEIAWVLRVESGRLRLLRRFVADEVVLTGPTAKLTWRGSDARVENWRFERGGYRRVR